MKKSNTNSDSSKLDRKTIERNRRIHMKALCFKLVSTIPSNYIKATKDMLTQQDQLDIAATYIKHLRERIDKLKEKKEEAMRILMRSNQRNNSISNIGSKLPLLEIRDLGSGIEVMLISGLYKNFMLYEVITVLEEEGAEVVTANHSTVGDKIFYTFHAQVKISRVGVEPTRVYQRLQELIAPPESCTIGMDNTLLENDNMHWALLFGP
ncbi:transcription factor bHLH162-like [Gastrolobium bilobum]|uniref:transcription factor bHLH162-like n=1 Tax=Gastrolobium bilobum TaxID=150636 RepID=UPI002AAF8CBA|nr:transcription factor bHLH162-like [Gastrolobium bilobum]